MAKKICSIDCCEKPSWCRTWCRGHYARFYRYGDPNAVFVLKTGSVRERFEQKFTARSNAECWLWEGARGKNWYGKLGTKGNSQYAHRIAWEFRNGVIPDGLLVLHKCDVKNCVNPDHLFLGTHKDNTADMMAKGRHKSGWAIWTRNKKKDQALEASR